ncbi:hypothetical protein MHBO_004477 [Bonamia ostreae]|uniref:Uncharacterized protein n=1 Tax=Bonamia ostreae TaxID=126728 RepID=A0ABV2AU41_9EUKA
MPLAKTDASPYAATRAKNIGADTVAPANSARGSSAWTCFLSLEVPTPYSGVGRKIRIE